MDKCFFRLNELQELGLPAARTLRNNLSACNGTINLGGDVPPIRTILIGGSRIVTKGELDRWLIEIEKVSSGQAAASSGGDEQKQKRRRGRPRKALVVGGRL